MTNDEIKRRKVMSDVIGLAKTANVKRNLHKGIYNAYEEASKAEDILMNYMIENKLYEKPEIMENINLIVRIIENHSCGSSDFHTILKKIIY